MHEERRGSRLPRRMRRRQIIAPHGTVLWCRGDWSNFDETWDMLRPVSESTPDAPMLTNFNIAQPLVIGGLSIIELLGILICFWLTGN